MTKRKHLDSKAAASSITETLKQLDSKANVSSTIKPKKQLEQQQKVLKRRCVGNFRSYYTYRLGQKHQGELEDDPRLAALTKIWFESKRGLDIGCNSGELTIAIAKHLAPSYLLGVDVDPQLISRARGHLKDLIRQEQIEKAYKEISVKINTNDENGITESLAEVRSKDQGIAGDEIRCNKSAAIEDVFASNMPVSFKLWKPSMKTKIPRVIGKAIAGQQFPFNVIFKQEDVVVDAHAGKDYDFITCFSVTKWIHLFHGDDGIKKVFQKIYELLVPGGRLVLEPQPWKSYHNRKFTTEVTAANYPNIRLRPKDFPQYLIDVIGFQSCELLKVCQTSSKGFRRPVYVAQK
ncbi:loc100151157 protein [Plasmopara halstedii]|uniref:RNA methyltransferase n=1 Tax=Plasmopara halstedii TaxID=4781 RepID=A0A0P1B6T1_PLAHL|nr:loc100151157 protein [Plasmopara halstedii]CEG49837.1 loc100151157 protein [Plasmopara halstedii]|eukprot:XP_024586206.1 loc100151157 protein [Plasmopara halstedii]